MMGSSNDPVEISVHFGPDEWSETGLAALVGSYQDMLHAMGASAKDTVTQVNKQEGGSVSIRVSWDRRGTVMHTMTGLDDAGRLVPHGNKPGLLMYTEKDGETYLELPASSLQPCRTLSFRHLDRRTQAIGGTGLQFHGPGLPVLLPACWLLSAALAGSFAREETNCARTASHDAHWSAGFRRPAWRFR